MKLKKIASLALAGVMAVSMLAGCSGKGNTTDDGKGEVAVTSDIVKAVNDGQSASNKVKVTFTSDSKLDTALERAIAELGKTATADEVKEAVANISGLKSKSAAEEANYQVDNMGFLTKNTDYEAAETAKKKELNGKTNTYVEVYKYDQFGSEDAFMAFFANEVNGVISGLADKSKTDGYTGDDKYYTYSYDGNASMVSVKNADGTAVYFVALVANQHITTKSF